LYNGNTPDHALKFPKLQGQPVLACSAPFYEIAVTEVPEIGDLVRKILIAMNGTVEMGLPRFQDAIRHLKVSDNSSNKDVAFLRKDFDEHSARVLAAAHSSAAAVIDPSFQLTGAVADELPAFRTRSIAVKISPDQHLYAIRRLTADELKGLYDAGTLPQHLYDEGFRRQVYNEEQARLRETPTEFIAVYRDTFRPLTLHRDAEPPLMGRFTVESADGSGIVRDSLQMEIGDLRPTLGQMIRFTAKPKDLYFEDYGFHHFDLSTMTVKEK
jgi:hypothetical protein